MPKRLKEFIIIEGDGHHYVAEEFFKRTVGGKYNFLTTRIAIDTCESIVAALASMRMFAHVVSDCSKLEKLVAWNHNNQS
jgi:hypothetical protein